MVVRTGRNTRLVAAGAISALLLFAALGATEADAAAPNFDSAASIGEIHVTDADPGQALKLVTTAGKTVQQGVADSYGSKIFYFLEEGAQYRVTSSTGGGTVRSPLLTVKRRGAHPKQSFYERQDLQQGLNYVTTRDGTKLAVTVRLPFGATSLEGAKFPTLIEYSGYQTAAPGDLITALTGGDAGNPDLLPASSTIVGAALGRMFGFATVSVQMRGSGCSGGAFDLFGLPTIYDGYDVVETVAAQDWVKGGRVGMAGISFSGITQLLTAGTRPPHLAAISPLSVTDDVYSATGYPGGIFNKGFAFSWITQRADDAEPAPGGGQPWARELADPTSPNYDPTCAANQEMRLQTLDFEQLIQDNPYRTPRLFDQRAPSFWMDKIRVPTFLVGAFQDEQTGGHFVDSLSRLKSNPNVWITLQNGVHGDSLGPSTMTRWFEFMKLFVANQVPQVPGLVLGLGDFFYSEFVGADALPIVQSRFAGYTSAAKAKTAFRRDKRVRLLMDNGDAIDGSPGALGGAWELNFSSWPIRSVKPTSWYLSGDGRTLQSSKPGALTTSSYVGDPDARPAQTITDGSEWRAQPNYDWQPLAGGKGLGFITPALTRDTVIAGDISVDLWLKSSAPDTDLQATLTEVRPDGKEVLVQSGWLRASHRKLDRRRSTVLNPVPTHLERDAAPLPSGRWTLVRVPVFAAAHAFRAGSKIRLNIQAPGGDRQIWDFDTLEDGTITNTIALGGRFASKLVLPVLPGVSAKTDLPPYNALRGQPWRDYAPATNGG
jgi:predicted acyl esterase